MKRYIAVFAAFIAIAFSCAAENITLRAVDCPAQEVFRQVMQQTYLNFIYSSDLLKDKTVSIDVRNKPIKKVLRQMFKDTDVTYRIKGRDVILMKKRAARGRNRQCCSSSLLGGADGTRTRDLRRDRPAF